MGLFQFLSGNDRSSDWAELGKHELRVNVAESSINGVRLGAPADDLSRLGRPSNKRPFKEGHFIFKSLGLIVEIENGFVSYFGLPAARDSIDNIGPCEFKMKFSNGREIEFNGATEIGPVLENLPSPSNTDVDTHETIYGIHVGSHCMELEVSHAGIVRRVNFYRLSGG